MATARIRGTLEVSSPFVLGTQGPFDGRVDPYSFEIDGDVHHVSTSLAALADVAAYKNAGAPSAGDDTPLIWKNLFFRADQDCYLQTISAGGGVAFRVERHQPFMLSSQSVIDNNYSSVAISNPIPATELIHTVIVFNPSATASLNYELIIVS